MLLLLVQQKLTNLTIDERYDLNVVLRMFTKRIIIQRRVADLQLGVESYQKKLNLTKLDTYRPNLRNKTAYTSYSDPHGIIYMDQYNRKRLMRTDKLHKFSDCMLYDVQTALHNIAARIRMEYLPMRKWSNLDKKRARVMVQDIDKQLYQRRDYTHFCQLSHSELVGIEKVAVCSSLRSLKPKCTIESRAKRDHP
ncbi:hypothetical protein Tco_1054134 [Tanacetum coccineum]|uniref:Uncharacterized protein n=1 Tax=Tanacetum coccineum TaxID=301880 RepID=A0ABQ5GY22_9ASTR